MPSSRNTTEDPIDTDEADLIIERLRQRVRRVTSVDRTARERQLAARVNTYLTTPQEAVTSENDPGPPPPELVRALQGPVGIQQPVVMNVFGRKVQVVINPLGQRRPDREAAVWKCIIEQALREAA